MELPKGYLFERLVLSRAFKSDSYFSSSRDKVMREDPEPIKTIIQVRSEARDSQRFLTDHPAAEGELDEPKSSWTWCWWKPGSSNLPSQYFSKTALHGLRHLADADRHICERVFWGIAFILSAMASAYLIQQVWDRYKATPVVVGFDSDDVDLMDIPFPAITICNMNKLSVDTINQLLVRANKDSKTSPLAVTARKNLRFAKYFCEGTKTFARRHGFAASRGTVDVSKYSESDNSSKAMYDFLQNSSLPCHELIRKCIWNGKERNCKQLFFSKLTPYGKCCSFNDLPITLMQRLIPKVFPPETVKGWEAQMDKVKEWRKWDYRKSFKVQGKSSRPRSQKRAGAPFGLSLLLDPRAERFFCPTTDSQGLFLTVDSPIDDYQTGRLYKAIELDREIFIEVTPALTVAGPKIADLSYERRQCLLSNEIQLDYFNPYTQANCFIECSGYAILKNCSCALYGMPAPYDLSMLPRTCSSENESKDRRCYTQVLHRIDRNIAEFCPHCKRQCAELTYHTKTRRAQLQNSSFLWFDHSERYTRPPDWAGHKMALVHIYLGQDSFVPRLRRELYGQMDLIANLGNLVTLCLGASALSVVELLYFFSLRLFWSCIRRISGLKVSEDRQSAVSC